MSTEIRVLRSIEEIERETWNALLRPEDSPFVDWRFLHTLEDAGCVEPKAGWLPCHLALFEDDALVAASPAYLKGNSEGEFVFDWRFADLAGRFGVDYYPKLLLAVPFTPATGSRFLVKPGYDRTKATQLLGRGALELAKQSSASSVHVNFLLPEEARALEAVGFHERHGLQYHWQRNRDATFESFLLRLPSKKRTQLRRERRYPSEQGILIRTLDESEYTKQAARDMFAFYRATVDKFMWGRRYLNVRFFERLAEVFRDRLAWVFATKNGVPIAGAFNIRGDRALYGRYWGASEDVPFLHFNVCYYHGIDDCLRLGLDTFEPGAGGEHKRARGFDMTVTRSMHHFFEPRLRGVLERHFDDERAAIARAITEGHED